MTDEGYIFLPLYDADGDGFKKTLVKNGYMQIE